MDERRARLLAKAEGVPVLGTVGLLEFGYRRGELADLRQVYQMLLAQGAHIDKTDTRPKPGPFQSASV